MLSILIGVNDFWHTLGSGYTGTVQDYEDQYAARVAAHTGATFVPLQAVFDERARAIQPQYWAADGVHPTPAGHAVIAGRWRRAAHL